MGHPTNNTEFTTIRAGRPCGLGGFCRLVVWTLIGLAAPLSTGCGHSKETVELRVLTDRTASHLENLFKYYEKERQVKITVNAVGESLLTRLAQRPKEADLVVTKNADLLEVAKQRRLLSPFQSQRVLGNVPVPFRDAKGFYIITSFRARALFFAKGRVSAKDLGTYEDLTLPKWKGRLCIRSGFHEYNVSWLSQMVVSKGLEETEAFIKSLRDNLAMPPTGDDRGQVRFLLEKRCDVAIANSYYMGIMRDRPDQRAWAEASDVFFPNQEGLGTYVMRAGAALTTATDHTEAATRLLDFLTDDFAQHYFAEALYEYPVKPGVPITAVNASLGTPQGIKGGAYKVNLVSLEEAAKHRDQVIEILNRVDFDHK